MPQFCRSRVKLSGAMNDYADFWARGRAGVFGYTTLPALFLSVGSNGLVLDNGSTDIDPRCYNNHGSVPIDLTPLDSGTTIVPRETDRYVFAANNIGV